MLWSAVVDSRGWVVTGVTSPKPALALSVNIGIRSP